MDDWLKNWIDLLLVNPGNKDEKRREGKWTEIIEENQILQYKIKRKTKMKNGCKWNENIVERCDKIKGGKRKANIEEEENNDNVNRRKKCSQDIKVTTYSQST